jgi:hypothetical protein
VAATCATPEMMFLRSLRRGRLVVAGFAILRGFLSLDAAAPPFAGG